MRKMWRSMYEVSSLLQFRANRIIRSAIACSQSIRVNPEGLAMLRDLAARKVPIVLLPCHKSHIDYILMR